MMVPMAAMAQDASLPGRGEVLELRADDARCPEGFRCFIAGRGASYEQMLERVNGGLEDASLHVSVAQFEAANPCRLIYRRPSGAMSRNGSCPSQNGTSTPVTWSSFCSLGSCARWTIATSDLGRPTVYRVPASRQLTPGERAEEMVRELDSGDIGETVPAPAELGGQLTELADLMGEAQPPTYQQTQAVIRSMGRTLTRASDASTTSINQTDLAASEALSAEETPAIAGTDLQNEIPGSQAETQGDTNTATADLSMSSPVLIVIYFLLIGLMLLVGALGYRLHTAYKKLHSKQVEIDRLRHKLETVDHDNGIRVAWNDAGMPAGSTEDTVALIKEMARSHTTIARATRDTEAWSPAYGDIHEELNGVLEEVGNARFIKQAIKDVLPGTDTDSPEKVRKAISRELLQVKDKSRESRALHKRNEVLSEEKAAAEAEAEQLRGRVADLEETERALSEGLELVREEAARKAQRIVALEKEREELEANPVILSDTPSTSDYEGMLELARSSKLHFEGVLDIFNQKGVLLEGGQVKIFGMKSHVVSQMLTALYGALMSLEGDLRQLHDRAFVGSTGKDIAAAASPGFYAPSKSSAPVEIIDLADGDDELTREVDNPTAPLERVETAPFSRIDTGSGTVIRTKSGIGKSNGKSESSKYHKTLPAPGPVEGE